MWVQGFHRYRSKQVTNMRTIDSSHFGVRMHERSTQLLSAAQAWWKSTAAWARDTCRGGDVLLGKVTAAMVVRPRLDQQPHSAEGMRQIAMPILAIRWKCAGVAGNRFQHQTRWPASRCCPGICSLHHARHERRMCGAVPLPMPDP